ncbi:Phytochrome-like protein cph1 [Stieleria maiorica]|uniref:Phytochrome-like protein cph1 n=1 Tax=Stieleria maiorica TaxID=2795974 RepID=A0A5B9M558_9BACT|nr:chemotaxis protein CheB [Stieleria maiorica]QEF96241.1 Phytochrome-like protein cph1 [Stieleria maiorica]
MDTNEPQSPPKTTNNFDFYVVGIGASAGGLEALEHFFDNVPAESGMAFVVVQHLSPDFKSLMDELLARHTSIPIFRVEDATRVKPNAIYLIPPKKNMTLSGGKLMLTEQDASGGLNLPIDVFFRSLAQNAGERAIAVVLSGTGSDGSRGVRDVHDAGGLVVVQDIDTAGFDGMPRSAIATGIADVVTSAREMGGLISSYANDPQQFTKQVHEQERIALPGTELQVIFRLFRKRFGIDFTLYRANTINRRIERRMKMTRCVNLADYVQILESDVNELDALYRDLLVEVTQFFRDPRAFERLRADVIPPIVSAAKEPHDEIRVWVPGCATGEEAYSIAILLDDCLADAKKRCPVKVFATDVHSNSLEIAAAGIYSSEALSNVPSELRARYFTRHGNTYQVSRELRKTVIFAPHDITKDPPFTKIDLLSCRNVLIYLESEVQKRVLALFHFGMKVGGVMVLGPSETVAELSREFDTLDQHWRIFRKLRDVRLPESKTMPLSPALTSIIREKPRFGGIARIEDGLESSVTDDLLERYVPPSLLVNEHYELMHSFGDARRILTQPKGVPTLEVLKMVEGELRMALSAALHRATREKERVVIQGIRQDEDGQRRTMQIAVEPYNKRNHSLYLVCIEEIKEPDTPREPAAEVFDASDQAAQRIVDLERELEFTKESLQSAVEELESSNEELQSTNEELVASNEELQSTNEELHSVNEELYTVNAEHQHKIEELMQLTSDMDNLLLSTEIGTIFLDTQLRIRKFTPAITAAFNIMEQDIGRPIDQFAYNLDNSELLHDAHRVLDSDAAFERKVSARDGTSYLQRIQPYRSSNGETSGVVITFTDISSVVHAELERKQRTHFEKISGDLQDFAYSVSHDLKAPIRQVYEFSRSLHESLTSKIPEASAEELQMLTRGAERLNELLNCLLEYSRVNTRGASPKPTDLGELVDELTDRLAEQLQHSDAIISRGILPLLAVDPAQFRALFEHLIDNAIKFSESPPRIEINAEADGDDVVISVSDNGIGIKPHHIDEIFVVFRRFVTRRDIPGNGLGLALCKRIVERHRGTIWVESEPGQGSTFFIRLPDVEEVINNATNKSSSG